MMYRKISLIGILFIGMVTLSGCNAIIQDMNPSTTTDTTHVIGATATPSHTKSVPVSLPTSSPIPQPTTAGAIIDSLPKVILPPFNPMALDPLISQPESAINVSNAGQVISLAKWGLGRIYEVDLSSDGSYLAVRTSQGVGLFETKTMREIHFLELSMEYGNVYVDPSTYNLLEFSPQELLLAVVVESQVHLLDPVDGSLLRELEGEGENYQLMGIAFSADGRLLAGSEGWSADINIWQVEDGTLAQTWKETPSIRLTFSPDGQFLVSENGEVHRLSDGSLMYNLVEPGYGVTRVMFSADGDYLAAFEGMEGKLMVWRTTDGQPLYSFDGCVSAFFSPDGQRITHINYNGELQTLSITDGNLIDSLKIDQPEFSSERILAFTPDGLRMVTTSYSNPIKLWDLSNGVLLYGLEAHYGEVSILQFSSDGEVMVTSDGEWVSMWLTTDGSLIETLRFGYKAPFVSPDGNTLVTGPYMNVDNMWVLNASDGNLRCELENTVLPISFSADSKLLAVSNRFTDSAGWITNTISVYTTSDCSMILAIEDGDTEFDDVTYDLTFSPDGSMLAAIRDPLDVMVWKLPDGEFLYTLSSTETFPFTNIALSPDGQYMATGNDYHRVLVFNAQNGEKLQELPMEATEIMGESGQVSNLVFSPDGKLLAATDEGGFYQIWQVDDWSTLQHNSDFINQFWRPSVAMAFSADSSILAVGGTGNAISLWSVTDGILLNTLIGHADDILRLGFSPDGSWIYSASLDGTVRFWGVPAER